jgi:hypothetical protein
MNPEDDRKARDRLAILLGLRFGGAVLTLLGLWMFLGGSVAGAYGFGGVLFVAGLVGLLVVPKILTRRWRTPR